MMGGYGKPVFVRFESGETFPINYYRTTDLYVVDLPCGVFEGHTLTDISSQLKQNFEGTRIVRK